jgi:hypothetical protein
VGRLLVPNFSAGGIAIPADASLVIQSGAEAVFVGSGIFMKNSTESADPVEAEKRARAIVKAAMHYQDPKVLLEVSEDLAGAMKGLAVAGLDEVQIPCEDYGLYVYISATASFAGLGGAHGLNGVTNMVGGGIPQYLNVSATEDGPNCDPFISPDDPSCSPMYADELYTCVEDFYYSGPIPFEWEVAQTSAYWNGTPTPSCNDYGQCTYVTHNNCTAATTPPDMSVPTVTSGYFVGDTYVCWMNTGVCVRPITGGRWYCTPLSFSYLQSINVPLAPYACTHNP